MNTAVKCWLSLALSLTSLSGFGCAVAPVETDAAGVGGSPNASLETPLESVGKVEQALSMCSSCQSSNQKYVVSSSALGPSTSSHICWPTRFNTPSTGTPSFFVYQANGAWHATGKGIMECVQRCCFTADDPAQDVRWLSPDFTAVAVEPPDPPLPGAETWEYMWQGDAMYILSGLYSDVTDNHGIAALDWFSAYDPTRLRVLAGYGTESVVSMRAYNFFVGKPQSGHRLQSVTFYTHSASDVPLISKDLGICVFTRVGFLGRDAGGKRRRATIYRSQGMWRLETIIENPLKVFDATVECYLYDQSYVPPLG